MAESTAHPFRAEVAQVLRLVVTSLYSHREIYLRELVSNASDALDKLRFEAIREQELRAEGADPVIRISADEDAGTVTIWDNGIGMTSDELGENLGTIARSGTREFLAKLEEAQQADAAKVQLIGQFGVGFYSAFLVADRVDVISRSARDAQSHRWSSDAKESYTLEPADRDVHGTTIVLHLRDDAREYLDPANLRALITRYSDFIEYPIELAKSADDKKEPEFEVVNRSSALWQRQPKDVSEEQYEELYKHISHDWESPLAHRHFRIEGTQEFSGIVYLPKRAPFDLFDAAESHGVRLHVRRVFVMDNCEELLPKWLRFVRGVVDSEDLPLNVSREMLQDSRAIRIIRKQVVNHALTMIEELADERPDDYATFWQAFGAVLKEGLHFDADYRDRLAKLVRYESTREAGFHGLSAYVERMVQGQPAIYYATGDDRAIVEASPHLEALAKRGYEVLIMTDPVDPFVVESLKTFDDKPLVSVSSDKLDLGTESDDEDQPDAEQSAGLLAKMKDVLGDRVAEVVPSKRLTDSPACLVVREGGLAPHVERMLRERKLDVPKVGRALEVNLGHPVLKRLGELQASGESDDQLSDWVMVIYDQALVAEGSPIDDPAGFAKRLTSLLEAATR